MAEQKEATAPAQTVQTSPKKRGPFFWIAIVGCGCLILLGCILGGIGLLCVTSEDFKEGFKEGYCEEMEKQNLDPEEDPFGICD